MPSSGTMSNTSFQPFVQSSSSLTVDFRSSLLAGIHINAGEVFASVEQDELVVSYAGAPGVVVESVHAFVGEDTAQIPVNMAGSPMVGQFPYSASNPEPTSAYTMRVPLQMLLSEGEQADDLCNREFFIAAHAGLSMVDDTGQWVHHSAWVDGPNRFSDSTWATYSSFTFSCNSNCYEAAVFGPREFSDYGIDTRRGWVSAVFRREIYARPVYILAASYGGQQDRYVGEFYYSYNGDTFTGQYQLAAGYNLKETNFYAFNEAPSVNNLSSYTQSHQNLNQYYDRYEMDGFSGYPFYIAAHALVCKAR